MLELRSRERGVSDEGSGMRGAVARSLRRKPGVGRGGEVRLLDGHQWIRDPEIVFSDGRSDVVEVRCACYRTLVNYHRRLVAGCGWGAPSILVGRWRPAR